MAYATSTEVSVEKTKAEIEKLLMRFGATKMATSWEAKAAMVGFQMKNRMIRFVLPLPDPSDPKFRFTPAKRFQRTPEEKTKAWEQACRARWRALYLCMRAKMEAIEAGITTFEEEFLAHIVIPGHSETMGSMLIPKLDEIYEHREMSKLLTI